MKWNGGLFPAPCSVERLGKAMGEPRWDGCNTTISLEVSTKMVENCAQDECFECQFEKMEEMQFFSQLNQAFSLGILVWDSKLLKHGNWGELGPF